MEMEPPVKETRGQPRHLLPALLTSPRNAPLSLLRLLRFHPIFHPRTSVRDSLRSVSLHSSYFDLSSSFKLSIPAFPSLSRARRTAKILIEERGSRSSLGPRAFLSGRHPISCHEPILSIQRLPFPSASPGLPHPRWRPSEQWHECQSNDWTEPSPTICISCPPRPLPFPPLPSLLALSSANYDVCAASSGRCTRYLCSTFSDYESVTNPSRSPIIREA